MKKSIFSTIIMAVTLMASTVINAQKFDSLDKSPMDAAAYPVSYRVSDKLVKVIYSRPQLKGRSLAKLAPEGKVWRTGANEAAEITFYKDVNFGGKDVKAGTYSLFTIPGKNEWTVILSSAKNVWGSYFYKEAEDVARITAKVNTVKTKLEAFSIAFAGQESNVTMYLGWDKTIVHVPIKS